MATTKITLNELRNFIKKTLKEESIFNDVERNNMHSEFFDTPISEVPYDKLDDMFRQHFSKMHVSVKQPFTLEQIKDELEKRKSEKTKELIIDFNKSLYNLKSIMNNKELVALIKQSMEKYKVKSGIF